MQPVPFSQLTKALLDENKPFPPRYLHRLSDLNPEDAAQLAAAWGRTAAWRREALMEDLIELSDADYVLSFEAVARIGLKDENAPVRMMSIEMLADYELADLIPNFLQMVENDPDAEVRARAATALGQYVYMGEVEELAETTLHKVEDCLLRVTSGGDAPLVRQRALESLGYSSREEVAALIEAAYNARSKDWLATALLAMGRSGQERWGVSVLRMLDHASTAVQVEAVTAAGQLELKEAKPELLAIARSVQSEELVRSAAIWALSEIGGPGVQQALEDLLEQADDDEEEFINEALENLAFTEDLGLFSLIDLNEADLDADDADEFAPPREDGEKKAARKRRKKEQ